METLNKDMLQKIQQMVTETMNDTVAQVCAKAFPTEQPHTDTEKQTTQEDEEQENENNSNTDNDDTVPSQAASTTATTDPTTKTAEDHSNDNIPKDRDELEP